jgi:D-lactate dehydrogenase
VIQDDVFARLLTFPKVIVTGHQADLTQEALDRIATVPLAHATQFAEIRQSVHSVRVEQKGAAD